MDYSNFETIDPWADVGDGAGDSSNMSTGNGDGSGMFNFWGYDQDFSTGDQGFGDSFNPGFDKEAAQNWFRDNNYSLRQSPSRYGQIQRGVFDNTTNRPVATTRDTSQTPGSQSIQSINQSDPVFQMASTALLGLANPATLGAQFGLTGLGASALGGGLLGTAAAGINGAEDGGDFAKGAFGGALAGGLGSYDFAGKAGITNQNLGNVVNRGVSGGLTAAARGGNIGEGAMYSALPAAITGGFNSAFGGGDVVPDDLQGSIGGNYDMAEGIGGGEMSLAQNDMNRQAMAVSPGVFDSTPLASAYAQQDSGPQAQESEQASPMSTMKDIFANGIPNGQGGRVPIGDAAGGLLGLFQALQQRRRTKGLAGQLSGLYGPNSPYAQNLRQQLLRKDAAGGRRSQYGAREVDFQARMADINSRMAPTLNTLNQQTAGNDVTALNSLLNLGKLFGGKGFSGIGGGGSSYTPYTPSAPMPAANYSLGNPNATLEGINQDWLKTLGNRGGI